jgi:hypothetical protein
MQTTLVEASAQFFSETVLPRIEKKLEECRQTLRIAATPLHVDNTKLPTFKMSIEKIKEMGFILGRKPRYYARPRIVRLLSVRLPETALGRGAFHNGKPGHCFISLPTFQILLDEGQDRSIGEFNSEQGTF